jgi:hypothetical protein
MRALLFTILLVAAAFSIGCGETKPATPLETFKTYVKAIKAKDTTTMKVLLSDATLKMHSKEAKSQGTTVDDIVKRQTLYAEGQKTVEYRNEKIDGQKATLEVKNSYGGWQTVPFVFEDGAWKIDTAGGAAQIEAEVEEQNRKFDEPGVFDAVQPLSPVQTTEP